MHPPREEDLVDPDFLPDEEAFRAELREFLEEELPDRWVGIFDGPDSHLDESFRITRKMAERGWLTQLWPREYGGQDASIWRQVVFHEEMWSYYEPRGGQYMGVNWIGPSIMRFGTEDQRALFLPAIAAGDAQWAQLFSEPEAGSDLANLRCRAELQGDEYIVNGEKIWTSYGDFAKYGFLLARCDPGSRRSHGLVVLLIDMDTRGITASPISTPLGKHKITSVHFDDVVIPAERVLGTAGDGWRVAMTALNFERTGVARYARATRTLGQLERRPEAAGAVAQDQLARALAASHVAELMNWSVISMREEEQPTPWQTSAARIHSVLLEQRVVALTDALVGMAVLADSEDDHALEGGELEEFTRASPTSTVSSGAFEIQMGLVAQHALGLERSR